MNDEIAWPCELTTSTKNKLIAMSMPMRGVNNLNQHALPAHLKSSAPHHRGLIYLSQGVFALCFDSNKTQTLNSVIIGKGMWFDNEVISIALQMGAIIEEIEPVQYLWFGESQILRLGSTQGECYHLLHYYKLGLRHQWIRAQQVSLLLKEVRVAYLLTELAQHISSVKGAKPLLLLSQDQLALMTGLSRPRVNEVLKILKTKKIISLGRGRLYIEDLQALQQYLPASLSYSSPL